MPSIGSSPRCPGSSPSATVRHTIARRWWTSRTTAGRGALRASRYATTSAERRDVMCSGSLSLSLSPIGGHAVSARIIDGKKIAAGIREEIRQRVLQLQEATGKVPGLAAVLIGDDPASATYV